MEVESATIVTGEVKAKGEILKKDEKKITFINLYFVTIDRTCPIPIEMAGCKWLETLIS